MTQSSTTGGEEAIAKESEAAKLNRMILRRMQKALAEDPEVDLLSKFPSGYSQRLARNRAVSTSDSEHKAINPKRRRIESPPMSFAKDDTRSRIRASDEALTLSPLSKTLEVSLALDNGAPLAERITRSLAQSEILYSTPGGTSVVLKLDHTSIVKIVHGEPDLTEYKTIEFLETHISRDYYPKPLGLVRLSGYTLMFMSYVPGKTLEAAWPTLDETQRISIRDQLDRVLTELRSLPCPEGTSLGGVDGKGCKDSRRRERRTLHPIYTHQEFLDFLFSNPHFGSVIYIKFIRTFLNSHHSPRSVFTHGDLRLPNIIVDDDPNGMPHITGIIDWELSGFYPEYWESLKVTNCLATNEDSDWYLYLPKCISPFRYPVQWLVDLIWDKHIE